MSKKDRKVPSKARMEEEEEVISNANVDWSMILPLNDEGMDIRQQLATISARYGMHLRMIAALPNAHAGRGYKALSGYVMVIDASAPLLEGIFDVNALFKGRVIVPLVDTKLESVIAALTQSSVDASKLFDAIQAKIPPETMWRMLTRAREEALVKANAEAESNPGEFVALRATNTPCSTPTFAIVKKSFGFDVPYIVFEDHANVRGDHGTSVLEEKLERAIKENETVDSFFFSRDMQIYYKSQLQWRSLVAHLLRAQILAVLLGDEALDELGLRNIRFVDARLDTDSHHVTNVLHTNSNGDNVYYSHALRATEKDGALICGGPFGEALWVNRRAQTIAKLHEVNLQAAVPFSFPATTDRAHALEEILGEVEGGTATDHVTNVRNPQPTSEEGVDTVTDSVYWLASDVSEGRVRVGEATLVLPDESERIRVIIPDLLRTYRQGLDHRKTWEQLEKCGVSREIEMNEPFQPVITVLDKPNVMDTLELWQVKSKLTVNAEATQ